MNMEDNKSSQNTNKKTKKKLNLKKLRISLKYQPKIFQLILKLRQTICKKNKLLAKYRHELEKKDPKVEKKDCKSQTTLDNPKQVPADAQTTTDQPNQASADEAQKAATSWDITQDKQEKSIAEQVAEVAQNALAETGMVYVESAGMYYDYKTGYYYSSELGLYYHPDTGCYYTYSDANKTFQFHSYPDTSKVHANQALLNHERKKAKKRKQESNGNSEPMKRKSKKKESKKNTPITKESTEDSKEKGVDLPENGSKEDMEDGECSDTASEADSDEESCASTSTASDDEAVSRHQPPCMRVIVKESALPKLKVGSLFLVTKDGGTVGREGDHHVILLKDTNVSRNHMEIRYDMARRMYTANDLGSKNGSILNGARMSESQVVSGPKEVPHGSIIQLGETKLLCHIHAGADTCGHCEPGLVMAADDKDKKVAYTRTCSVQKQHALELARLKNMYAPQPLAIEDGSYKDRAKERRETVGSTHGSEKTQQSDLETSIAPDNKGFQLLKKMGWSKGEGLGKDSQGDTEPIPLVSNETKAGLGAAGSAAPVTVGAIGSVPLRMTRAKPLRPPAKLFRDPLEEDDD